MDERLLGGSGVGVSRIILGCGNFGGIGSAPAPLRPGHPARRRVPIMDAALELGITTFDTADAYGGGRSETLHRRVARERARTFATGSSSRRRRSTRWTRDTTRGLPRSASGGRSSRACAGSGSSASPLYLAHAFDPDVPQEETLARVRRARAGGKVGAVGASNFTAEQLAEALELVELEGLPRFEWVQNGFSLLEQDDRETVFPVCHEHGLGYTPFSPLAGGWLTGKYRRDEAPPAGSRMTLRPERSEGYRTRRGVRRAGGARARGRARVASRWPVSPSPGRSRSPR